MPRPYRAARTNGSRYYSSQRTIKRSRAYPTVQVRLPSLSSSVGAQPKTIKRKLVYTGAFSTADAANPTGLSTFRGNGLYDPDFAIGGAQPAGFDELMALYNRYSVKSSVAEAVFFPSSTSAGTQGHCWIVPTTQATALTAVDPFTSIVVLRDCATKALGTSGVTPVVIKNSMSTKEATGVSHTDADCQGTDGTDPVNQWYWQIGSTNYQNGNNTSGAYVTYKIIYEVEFSDPRNLALS